MGSSDFGILISQQGAAVNNAQTAQILFDSSKPFIKMDTQNPVSFQSILLIITTNPPEPTGGATDNYTTLFSFAHGYKYVPSLETLFFVKAPPPSPNNNGTQTYFQDSGQIGGASIGSTAYLYTIADKTNVYCICHKQNFDGVGTLLTGTNVLISSHVFVEDIGV